MPDQTDSTIDDILAQAYDGISDPIVRDHVVDLNEAVEDLEFHIRTENWLLSHAALLDVCRTIQLIRLEVGNLAYLEQRAKEKVKLLLTRALSPVSSIDPDQVMETIEGYLRHFDEEEKREWAYRAAYNISSRLQEACGEEKR